MNNNGLMNFDFNNNVVRVITTENDILFVASDVAKVLGYIRPNDAVTSHCKKANSLINIVTVKYRDQQNQQLIGLDQKTKLIPESDVYRLVMRSKLESAEKFQDWVMEDVLPAIRKTGKYSIEQSNQPSLPTTYLDALKALVVSEEQKLLLENKVKDDAPKVEFANDIFETEDLITVENFAKLLGTGRNRLFRRLRIDGYLGGNHSNFNVAYQHYIDEHRQPFFKVKEKIIYVDGKSKIHKQSLITGKGQLYFQKKYNGVKI